MKKSLIWGLAFGVMLGTILSLCSFSLYLLGRNPIGSLELGYLFPSYLAVMAGGLFYFRNYQNRGELPTGMAILMTFSINLIAALLYSTCIYFMFTNSPETLELWREQMVEVWLRTAKGMQAPDIDAGTVAVRATTPSKIAIDKLMKISVMGLPFALVVALAFRRRLTLRNQKEKT